MGDQHITKIDEVGGFFVARCICGWQTVQLTDRKAAANAARFHRVNAQVQK